MKKCITFILFVIVMANMWVVTATADENVDKLTPSGISYKDIEQEIGNFILEREEGLASCSVAVIDGQETLYREYFGYMDIEKGVKADENTVYEWGSVSKVLVWISVMQLYEHGKLNLNVDIGEYLPEDFLTKLKYKDKITMLNLMNHNAGWQETTYDLEVKDQSKLIELEKALQINEPSQIYRPGEITAYSNWGTALAAYIVERVSGVEYSRYIQENIFTPLEMKHTSVSADYSDNLWVKDQREKLKCYSITKDASENLGSSISYIQLYPAGSATGTLEDLIKLAKAFTIDSEACPLFQKENTLSVMLGVSSYYGGPGATSNLARVCHGLWTMEYAIQVKGHGGNTNGCTANLLFDDKSGLGVIVMTNEVGETAFCYGIPELVFGSFQQDSNAISDISNINGIYQSMRTIKKGFLKIIQFSGNLFPISKTDIAGTYKMSIGEGIVTYVKDNIYVFDNGNGMRAIQYLYINNKGETYLQQYTCDYKLANPIVFWTHVILIFLALISIVYSFLYVIFIIVKRCVEHSVNSDAEQIPFMVKWLRRACLIAMMLVGILFYQLVIKPLDGGMLIEYEVKWKCMFNGILSFIPVVYVVSLLYYWQRIRCHKKAYICTALMGLILTFSIWFWQWFNYIC